MDVSIVARELQEVENMIEIVRKDLEGAPEGRLRIACKRGNEQYYQVTKDSNTQGHYISKKNNDKLIKSLAQKDYAKKYLSYLVKKRDFIKRMDM